MEMKELYERYGQLQIQAEITNGQIMEVKKAIAQKMNEQNQERVNMGNSNVVVNSPGSKNIVAKEGKVVCRKGTI